MTRYPIIGAAKSGTQNMIDMARKAGIEVVVRDPEFTVTVHPQEAA